MFISLARKTMALKVRDISLHESRPSRNIRSELSESSGNNSTCKLNFSLHYLLTWTYFTYPRSPLLPWPWTSLKPPEKAWTDLRHCFAVDNKNKEKQLKTMNTINKELISWKYRSSTEPCDDSILTCVSTRCTQRWSAPRDLGSHFVQFTANK